MKAAATDPNLLATDIAEYLVKKGIPFRRAHAIVGKLVAGAARKGKKLTEMPRTALKKISPRLDVDLAKTFSARRALAARSAIGAPSPKNIQTQIKRWRKELR
jgi:argininosuccinate lyase